MYICVPTQQHEMNTSEMSDQSLIHPKTSWFEKNGLFTRDDTELQWTYPGMQILPLLKLFRAVRDILGILNIGCQTLAMDNLPILK
jgi:hypothetical protein